MQVARCRTLLHVDGCAGDRANIGKMGCFQETKKYKSHVINST